MRTRTRSVLLTLALGAVTAAGCTTSPLNGTTVSGSGVFKSFTFTGYYNLPNTTIRLDVMKNPTLDPALNSSWEAFAVAQTNNIPIEVNSPGDPLYQWEVVATPVPHLFLGARWPLGGLVRLRAVHQGSGKVLATFDEVTFEDCFAAQVAAGASWADIGSACNGVGGTTTTFVSTAGTPSGGFLSKTGTISEAETEQYYAAIGAPTNLDNFKAAYGFGPGDLTATYYNDGDLGLGREMHCKLAGASVACYVVNYSGVANEARFDQDPTLVLADAVAHTNSFATVAMVADPPFDGPNSIKFMVYGPNGRLATRAALDSTGEFDAVPNNCLSCHGINARYDAATNSITGAKFLPFDPFSFTYSTQVGFTAAAQANALRQLNALITLTQPTPATLEYITGLYAPKAVTDPTAVANPDFVPSGWASAGLDGVAIYNGVVKSACRTCHMSSTNPLYDFAQEADFATLSPLIRAEVCGNPHLMPHAERVMKKFWASGARALLISAYPPPSYPEPLLACKP